MAMRLERSESQRLQTLAQYYGLIAREQTTRFTGGSDFTIRTTNVANAIINDMASKGKGRQIIMDSQDYERVMATIKLMDALEIGRKSGEEQGWISLDQLKNELEI